MPGDSGDDQPMIVPVASGSDAPVKAVRVRQPKACQVCRTAKMKCVGADSPPCVRCKRHGVDCIFLDSRRGRPRTKPLRPSAIAVAAATAPKPKAVESAAMAVDMGNDIPVNGFADVYGSEVDLSMSPATSLQHFFGTVVPTESPHFTINPLPSPFSQDGDNLALPPIAPAPHFWEIPSDHSPPTPTVTKTLLPVTNAVYSDPLGLLAEAASSQGGPLGDADAGIPDADGVGIASRTYFDEVQSPTTSFAAFVEKAPIMKLITLEDVETLFSVFLQRLHVHSPAIDRDHCTPESIASRSELLFNCICCISSRYNTSNPALVPILHSFAKKELAKFPTEKSLEAVQAEILYTGFGLTPSATYQQDTVWLRVGMATRMALDISLHLAGTPAYKHTLSPTEPWRLASMKRTWLLCCSLDKMLSCQMGKPSIILDIPEEGFSTEEDSTTPDDRRVYANVEMAQIITRGMEASRKYSKGTPAHDGCLSDAIAHMESDLEQWWETWNTRIMIGLSGSGASGQGQIRQARLKLYHSHAKLMSASITLQHALDIEASDPTLKPFALAKYQSAALAILTTFRDDFVAHGHAEYLTDYQYGYLLSAAVALLKSLQPQFKHSLISVHGAGKLIESTAAAFENCAADQLHLPNLQGKFLRRILRKRLPAYQLQTPATPSPLLSMSGLAPPPPPLSSSNDTQVGQSSQPQASSMLDAPLSESVTAAGWDSSMTNLNFSRQGSPFNTSPTDYSGASWATDGWEAMLDVGMFDPQAIFQPGVFDNL